MTRSSFSRALGEGLGAWELGLLRCMVLHGATVAPLARGRPVPPSEYVSKVPTAEPAQRQDKKTSRRLDESSFFFLFTPAGISR